MGDGGWEFEWESIILIDVWDTSSGRGRDRKATRRDRCRVREEEMQT